MSAINPASASKNNSTNSFLTALAVNAVLLAVEVGAFLILKQKLWRVYMPRAYLPPPEKRADELPKGLWRWLPALLTSPPEDIIEKNGLDAYMFLRFIKILVIIFVVFTVLTFAVIIPVDATVQFTNHGLKEGIEKISWANIVDPRDQQRFSAHIVVVYVLTAFVLYMIRREMLYFIRVRQEFLLSKHHSGLAQARTVLVTSVPDELGNEHDLRTFASFVPGGVDKVWLYRDTRSLNKLFERRQEECERLEAAEAELLKRATLAWRKKLKAHRKTHSKKTNDVEHNSREICELDMPEPTLELLNELVPANKRPRHRTGWLGLWGTKVDTIEHCKKEISELNVKIKDLRKEHSEGKFLGSAFIRCNLQMGAHILCQCVSYHEPLYMTGKWTEAHPKDIVWSNLDDGALEMKSRYVTSWLATVGLIIAWAFPVGFIGTLSNLSELCTKVSWLAWVCRAPRLAQGLIEGVFPPALLALLFILLPFILQALAWYECIPRYSLISVSVYRRFYFFLLIHGFLIVTLTSGITEAITEIIQNPTQTVQKLASELPGASVFFLTYMVTQGLAGAGMALVQLAPVAMHFLRKWFLGRTPRQAYMVTFTMPAADFGVILPRISLLATITFAYSVLSPLINLLALISFGMFYIAWKFLLVQVFDQPDQSETGGMYFPMAINNLFVGLYIEHLCLACLFFLKAKDEGVSALVKGGFMLALLIMTAVAHIFMRNSFNHLLHYLPMSLATKKMAKKFEKERQKHKDEPKDNGDDEIDLFSRDKISSVRKRIKRKVENMKMKASSPEPQEKLIPGAEPMGTVVAALPDLPSADGGELTRQKTNDSQVSKKSKQSAKKPKVSFDTAAPAVKLEDDDSDEEEGDDHAFDHPSTYQEQSWIWIPKDTLGLSELLAKDLRDAGVDASDVGATMDEKGIVDVRRGPPDEEWRGGHDA